MSLTLDGLHYKRVGMPGGGPGQVSAMATALRKKTLCRQVRPKERGIALQVPQGLSGAELPQG